MRGKVEKRRGMGRGGRWGDGLRRLEGGKMRGVNGKRRGWEDGLRKWEDVWRSWKEVRVVKCSSALWEEGKDNTCRRREDWRNIGFGCRQKEATEVS